MHSSKRTTAAPVSNQAKQPHQCQYCYNGYSNDKELKEHKDTCVQRKKWYDEQEGARLKKQREQPK
jgi:hypothetical protein